MPELPEVETIKNILKTTWLNKTIDHIEVLSPKMIKGDVSAFYSLEHQTLNDIQRKGKFLIFFLSNHLVLLSHLRMEGKFYLFHKDENNSRFARIIFYFTNDEKMCYDDSRKFGVMKVIHEDELKNEPWLSALGPEPFDIEDTSSLLLKAQKIHTPIKPFIMDQHVISGIGNIYADEILYRSHISPLESASHLIKEDWDLLISNAKDILKTAIQEQGTTIRSYHPSKDMVGNFQNQLFVYGKKGDFCPTCHTPFMKIMVGGRGTTFCPNCQKKKYPPIVIGLTGAIGSGKSYALNYFESLGLETISSDVVVRELYQDKSVQKHLISMFGKKIIYNQQVDFSYLRSLISVDSHKNKMLQDYLYPLVRNQLELFILHSNSKIVVIEVPLLFESHMDTLCDITIAIKISNENQRKNLKKRGQKEIDQMLLMNYKGDEYPYGNQVTYYLDTNNNKKALEKALKKIYKSLINGNTF